jgi:rhodanese-related sulfurtransferase
MKKLSYLAAFTLLSLMIAGCAVTHGTSPKGLEVPIEKAAVRFSADLKEGGYKIVTTDELKKWLDEGKKMTVLSSLPWSEDRVLGVIPGALSAPLPKNEKELTPEDKESLLRAAGDDKDKVLVVYCGFVACRRSHIGAKLLTDNGYRNVYRYPAGITGWTESGYPLKKMFD